MLMRVHRTRRRPARALAGSAAALLLSGCSGPPPTPTLTAANARFEFLTPSLVRMQYSPSGRFVDAPTAVVQKRDWPAVPVSVRQEQGWLIATSSALTLRYRLGSGPFGAANLQVSWKDPAGSTRSWRPGDPDPLNLGGLTYSLDNISHANLPEGRMDLESPVNDSIPGIDLVLEEAKPGLLSRSGYAFIDDSSTPVWNARRTWIEPRLEHGQDWYLFAYNRDYPQVLREYAQLCGPVPMIPRYVLGPWITDLNFEYFPDTAQSRRPGFRRYGQSHLEEEATRLRDSAIPFDTLVLDFAWHNYGWDGGYDWSPLLPRPDEFVNWLHARGIKLALNDHPGYIHTDESILSFADSHAPQVVRDLGRPLPPRPSLDIDIAPGWSLATDPADQGLKQHWYENPRATHWRPIRTGLPWQEQGYGSYRGIAWYHAAVRLPQKLPAALYLQLGEVGGTYRIFVNGHEATHSLAHWPQRLTYTDMTAYAIAGKTNDILLRIEPGPDGGGILRGPVAIRDVRPPERIYFDLSNEQQAAVFMRDLHGPLMKQGVDLWWVDGGSGSVDMPGLNKQLWTNKVFYDYSQEHSGRRGFILGRYGDWGSERYPGFFTGDTYSEWPVLAYEVAFTARGGNVLVPYISHDIGGFHGARIDFDLYARWIEFGTFSPLLRMHSAHANPREGNTRMPWLYGREGVALMKKYFTLRTQLIPYLYTYTWVAHRDALPILRPLYLAYPELPDAYQHPHEYFFGEQLLIAPVLDPQGDETIYLPPGRWLDFFSGRPYDGGRTLSAHYATDQAPVFVRDGAVIPLQMPSAYSNEKPLDSLILNVYGSARAAFDLYEDDGSSLAFQQGQFAQTPINHATDAAGIHQLQIGPTRGSFAGQVSGRSYQLRIHASAKPVSLAAGGREIEHWRWLAGEGTAVAELPQRSIRERVTVQWH
jgi:alpha-glucosidase (family GH31 glycosyl hydrolase)